jgi:Ca-activated chloride channel family protein
MRLTAPWILLSIPLGLWYLQRVYARSFVGPRRSMMVARAMLLITLVVALTRPEINLPTSRVDLLALVDDSASILPSRRAAIQKTLQDLAARTPGLQVWRFGAVAQQASADAVFSATPQTETRLERSLFTAGAALPSTAARRIVLFSDGRETDGEARRAARALGEEHVPVFPVKLPPATDPEVLIAGMRAPDGMHRGEPVEISITVRSTLATKTQVTLSEGGRPLWEDNATLKAGDTELRAAVSLPTSGLVQLRAEVVPAEDTLRENNARERTIYVEGPPRVLLGTPRLNQVSALADALILQGIDVIRFDPTGVPQSLEELAAFDAIILDEIPPGRVDISTQELFETFVRDLGGGLIYITGHAGLGTYDRTAPLQRALPLGSEERVENQVPPVAMILVIDRSGSMDGEKLRWTKRAALGTLEELPQDGQLGVLAFDAEFHWIVPLSTVRNKAQIAEQINALGAGGGTRFYPALEAAYYKLGEVNAAVKHIVLLTDGLSTDGVDFKPLARKMAEAGITVTTVAMSKEADGPLLKSIAQIAGGRFHSTEKPTDVPRIFSNESKLVTKKADIDRPFHPVPIGLFEPIARIDFAKAPQLYGFVASSLRPGAEEVLAVEQGKQPLMARWRYGLGQVIAFASDTDGSWARSWVAWPEYARLWAETVRHTMRDRSSTSLIITGRVVDGTLEASVDVEDARARSAKEPIVELYAVDPSLVRNKVELEPTGPGLFHGRLAWPMDGNVVLNARVLEGSQVLASSTRIIDRPIGREYTLGDDEETLAQIAQLSGGEVIEAADLGRLSTIRASHSVACAPYLLAFAFLLLMVDLFIKRVRPTAPAQPPQPPTG